MAWIQELTVISGTSADIEPPEGCIKIAQDLNEKAGGKFVYLCYKTCDAGRVVTDILISASAQISGYIRNDVDLNSGTHGRPLYLFYKQELLGLTTKTALTGIVFVTGENAPAPAGCQKIDVDLNRGAGGKFIYLCYCRKELYRTPLLCEWMRYIADDVALADLSIPGTHDSTMWTENMRGVNNEWTQTQYLPIEQQFEAGVRMFDLRVFWQTDPDRIGLCHTTSYRRVNVGATSKLSLDEVFGLLVGRLVAFPRECILVWISVEQDITGDAVTSYKNGVERLLRTYRDYIYVDSAAGQLDRGSPDHLPTLGQVRGKIFLISDAIGKKKLNGGNCQLEKGYRDDPWRTRYRSETDSFDVGDAAARKTVLSGAATFCGGNNAARSKTMFEIHLRKMAKSSELEKKCFGRCFAHEAWEPLKRTPYSAALRNNPQIIEHLKQRDWPARAGVGGCDFVGRYESLELTWEYIRTNPQIWEQFSNHSVAKTGFYIFSQSNLCIGCSIEAKSDPAQMLLQTLSKPGCVPFELVCLPSDYYLLQFDGRICVLDVEGDSTADGARVINYPSHGRNNQQWRLEHCPDGVHVLIVSRSTEKCITVENGKFQSGAKLVMQPKTGSPAQQFEIKTR